MERKQGSTVVVQWELWKTLGKQEGMRLAAETGSRSSRRFKGPEILTLDRMRITAVGLCS